MDQFCFNGHENYYINFICSYYLMNVCQVDSFQMEVKNVLETCKMSIRINKAPLIHLSQFHISNMKKIKQLQAQ